MKKNETFSSFVLSCFAAIAFAAAGWAAVPATIVYPTGLFPADVFNVQNAINNGGNVLLKATDAGGAPKAFN